MKAKRNYQTYITHALAVLAGCGFGIFLFQLWRPLKVMCMFMLPPGQPF